MYIRVCRLVLVKTNEKINRLHVCGTIRYERTTKTRGRSDRQRKQKETRVFTYGHTSAVDEEHGYGHVGHGRYGRATNRQEHGQPISRDGPDDDGRERGTQTARAPTTLTAEIRTAAAATAAFPRDNRIIARLGTRAIRSDINTPRSRRRTFRKTTGIFRHACRNPVESFNPPRRARRRFRSANVARRPRRNNNIM